MSKDFFVVPRSALRRALIACRDNAIALAATALNVAANQRSKQQSRRRAIFRDAALHADSGDKLALEVWVDDGGYAGTSEVDDRYKARSGPDRFSGRTPRSAEAAGSRQLNDVAF